jgi:tubulin alpha
MKLLRSAALSLLVSFVLILKLSMASSLRNAVVTGANRGLGLEICRQLGNTDGYGRIFALCRKTSPELTKLASEDDKVSIVEGIDMVQGGYEDVLAKSLTLESGEVLPVALLCHNAGAYGPPEDFADASEAYASQSLQSITPERLLYTFQLNSAAPLFLTKMLLPHLKAAAGSAGEADAPTKVIIISSLMGSLSDNTSGGHYGYRAAKAAVNMIGKSLSADLAHDKIAVGLVHPGYVHTGFGLGPGQAKRPGQRDVGESTAGVLQAMDATTMETTGTFWHANYGEGIKELSW